MKGVSIIDHAFELMQAKRQNCHVGRQWQPKHGESHPYRLSAEVVSQKFADMNDKLKQMQAQASKPLTDCGKPGLCDERSHGSRFWCGICCKQG